MEIKISIVFHKNKNKKHRERIKDSIKNVIFRF